MQFVANGPDVPETLLQAHEEGRVVFFCGAGISYPAGLPDFKGLVDKIYAACGEDLKKDERVAYRRHQYDATLALLERRLIDPMKLREAVADVLKPSLSLAGATETHSAILRLARTPKGDLRLVTTNFDRVFEDVASVEGAATKACVAPMLPVPKPTRWNGLVYLHGRLPEGPDRESLSRLVLTSGDFGQAYLTERWAARFTSELFRHFIVCFVGYSINDPVMRYMMDALAADRMLGEFVLPAYAFGSYRSDNLERSKADWAAKGVVPILYEVPRGGHDHSLLHRTLKAWSETFRDGVLGKENIVTDLAMTRPTTSTKEDDFVARMLWALSDGSGLPARRFADFDPAPSIEWLNVFSEPRYRHEDLARFGVAPNAKPDPKLKFSFVKRPTPYGLAQEMALVAHRPAQYSGWDLMMWQMARWLVRYLDHPSLLRWVAKSGGHLDGILAPMIEQELSTFAKLEADGDTKKIDRIRATSPHAIPRKAIRPLWRLLLNGYVKHPSSFTNLYQWQVQFRKEGLSGSLRMKLRELLAPRITLREPFRWVDDGNDPEVSERLKDIIDWELVLAEDHAQNAIEDLRKTILWEEILGALIDDFELLLGDALGVLKELGEANEHSDRSFWDLPSIAPHWQNRGFREWVVLIELTRDAWLKVFGAQPHRAQSIARAWFEKPFPTFKRLALFAASQVDCIPPEEWAGWLLMENARWLWRIDTRREVMRLLTLQGHRLTADLQVKIEASILNGPPRGDYKDDLDPDHWQSIADDNIWIRLAKLQSAGLTLGSSAQARLKELSDAHPYLKFRSDEREEFSHWISGTGDPDYEPPTASDQAPRTRKLLVTWLKLPRDTKRDYGFVGDDGWDEVCRTRLFHVVMALHDLGDAGDWQASRLGSALRAWSQESLAPRSWCCARELVLKMPDQVFLVCAQDIARWLEGVSKKLDRFEPVFLALCRRVIEIREFTGFEEIRTLTSAINHPIGIVTQALLNVWLKQDLKDGMKLSDPIEPLFTAICDAEAGHFRAGRMMLASRVITLFRVDREWAEAHVLPRFNWKTDRVEAQTSWEGFLWSPRLYLPLFVTWKTEFLDACRHYSDFNEQQRNLVALLTYAALERIETYTDAEFRSVFSEFPQEALDQAADIMVQALEGAGEQKEAYWENRLAPFWQSVWPKSANLASKNIAASFARLCVAAGTKFPDAFATLRSWLQPLTHPFRIFKLLKDSGICQRHPREALRLLVAIVDNHTYVPKELGQCLDQIVLELPDLGRDRDYQCLRTYSRQRGH